MGLLWGTGNSRCGPGGWKNDVWNDRNQNVILNAETRI